MTGKSPKISFAPTVPPEATAQAVAAKVKFGSGPANTSQAASAGSAPSSKRTPNKAPSVAHMKARTERRLAPSGLMAAYELRYMRRSAMPHVLGTIVTLIFALGVTAALPWTNAAPDEGAARATSGVAALQAEPRIEEAPADAQAKRRAVEATSILSVNMLRSLREGVLAGVYTVQRDAENGVEKIRLRTANTDIPSNAIATMMAQATDEGRIAVAAALRTAQGGMDVDKMMFKLAQKSLIEEGTDAAVLAARDMALKAFAALVATTDDVGDQRVYTVQAGDSLAYIPMQFYGSPDAYARIIEANRDTLHSPDAFQSGQRLFQPS